MLKMPSNFTGLLKNKGENPLLSMKTTKEMAHSLIFFTHAHPSSKT